MRIIADTSVWSLFLRRRKEADPPSIDLFRSAIQENRVQMLGIIRQELLSGMKSEARFRRIGEILEGFPDLLAESRDHTEAARFFNQCRRKGIQGSPVDFLICAQAARNKMAILTEDRDFERYARHLPISLCRSRVS